MCVCGSTASLDLISDALGNLGELLARELVPKDLHDALDLRILRVQLHLLVLQLRALEKTRLVGGYLVLEAFDEGLVRAGRDLCIQLFDLIHSLVLVGVHVRLSSRASSTTDHLFSQLLSLELLSRLVACFAAPPGLRRRRALRSHCRVVGGPLAGCSTLS